MTGFSSYPLKISSGDRLRYVITYDIADDRREDVATLLSGYGPRVQLSLFECGLRNRREAAPGGWRDAPQNRRSEGPKIGIRR